MDRRGLATSMRRPFRAIAMFFGLAQTGHGRSCVATLSSVKHSRRCRVKQTQMVKQWQSLRRWCGGI